MHGNMKLWFWIQKGVANNKGKESAMLHNKLKGLIQLFNQGTLYHY